ncbi:MAG: hypothetical protein CSA34_01175 [Desulfobulbus propionicus]|nr:MAG: hypothetical protein CSA34_01175 [Desulfobulbus propionicus]
METMNSSRGVKQDTSFIFLQLIHREVAAVSQGKQTSEDLPSTTVFSLTHSKFFWGGRTIMGAKISASTAAKIPKEELQRPARGRIN